MKNHKRVVRGAVSLGLGALMAKILGVVYRIPLTNYLGSYGLGLYQMVFPVYTLLLDFSGAGVPSAISKLIASGREDEREKRAYDFLTSSLRLLFILGAVGMVFMILSSIPLSTLQGDQKAYLGYLFLSPAIVLFALISCFRGYFQGLMDMSPTAISQVIEQVVKLVFGLLFVKLLIKDVTFAVAGATFAITLSEVVAIAYLYYKYRRRRKVNRLAFDFDRLGHKRRLKTILKTTIPVTLIGVMLPLSHVIDSFIVVNVLSGYRSDATSLYGLISGVAHTVVNLPVAVCYGVASVAIPAVSSSIGVEEKRKNAVKTLSLTAVVSIVGALLCYFFAPLIIRVLFRKLSVDEKNTSLNLIRLLSPTVVLLSVLQTSNAVLIGMGKLYSPIFSLGVGVALKTVLALVLLNIPSLNVYGSAIATIACYFFVCLVNLIMIFAKRIKYESSATQIRRSIG